MRQKLVEILLFFGMWVGSGVMGARILFHMPTPCYSHNAVYTPIIREMARRGHQVVSITTHPIPASEDLANITQIDVSFVKKHWDKQLEGHLKLDVLQQINMYQQMMHEVSDLHLQNPEVAQLISNSSEHFDLVVVEWVGYYALFGWAHRFRAPLVGLFSADALQDGHDFLGNPVHPYTALNFVTDSPIGSQMGFWQRMKSIYIAVMIRWQTYFIAHPQSNVLARRHFGQDTPPVGDLGRNVSIVITNRNQVLGGKATVPAMVLVDMLHIKEPEPLPKELKEFLDNRTSGVVYFSLGSHIKSSEMSSDSIEEILQAFSALPYGVLWKWEDLALLGKPPNVKLCQWCPQQDILAHPNVKLFMTQGGLQSIEEAIYFRVPILGIPIETDQLFNIVTIKSKGAAEILDVYSLDKNTMHSTIMKMMQDQRYSSRMSSLADLFQDQPQRPLERAAWWLEHVLRHGGAAHLRAALLPWYQLLMLDAALLLLAAGAGVTVLLTLVSRGLSRLVSRKRKVD